MADINVIAKKILRRLPAEADVKSKHAQLSIAIKALIREGTWKTSEKLPSESELAQSLPFSLGTIQRSFRDLVEEGLVVRKRGYGTYIPADINELTDAWHMRFRPNKSGAFLPVYTQVLRRFIIQGRGHWSEDLEQKNQRILRVDRRMQIGNEFSVYARFYACADSVRQLAELPISALNGANIKKLIMNRFSSQSGVSHNHIEQATIPKAGCLAINVPMGTTGTLLTSVVSFGNSPAVYYQQFFIPPNNYKLLIESRFRTGI
ncbi:MAG TPA: GntR family transcriptional regulator [Paenalcaligenes sp.]|nr:GntR family transcriptional regulator [Paenalcaligenes sp.]